MVNIYKNLSVTLTNNGQRSQKSGKIQSASRTYHTDNQDKIKDNSI